MRKMNLGYLGALFFLSALAIGTLGCSNTSQQSQTTKPATYSGADAATIRWDATGDSGEKIIMLGWDHYKEGKALRSNASSLSEVGSADIEPGDYCVFFKVYIFQVLAKTKNYMHYIVPVNIKKNENIVIKYDDSYYIRRHSWNVNLFSDQRGELVDRKRVRIRVNVDNFIKPTLEYDTIMPVFGEVADVSDNLMAMCPYRFGGNEDFRLNNGGVYEILKEY